GHDTKFKKATDEAYNSLPSCCLYRNKEPGGQEVTIKGMVMSMDGKGKFAPLANASVYWLGSATGILTDSNGFFMIPPDVKGNKLVISYTGYKPDTVTVTNITQLRIILASGHQLQDVTVYARNRSYYASSLTPVRTQVIG